MKRQEMIKHQKEAIEYIKKFIANSKHEESTCCVFDEIDTEKDGLNHIVEMYLGTWVLTHLNKVLDELENGK